MDLTRISQLLDTTVPAAPLLRTWGLADPAAGRQRLLDLAQAGVPLDLLSSFADQLDRQLPLVPDPDRTLERLVAFILAQRSPLSFTSLIDRDPTTLPMLLQVLGGSPRWAEQLIADPEAFDLLRMTDGQPVTREELAGEILREVASLADDERAVFAALRRIHRRETLRIGYGELFRHVRVEIAMQQLTFLAEVLLEAALHSARARIREAAEQRVLAQLRLSVIALGRLGAETTDYDSPLELFFLSDHPPGDEDRRGSPAELVERVARQTLRLLTDATEDGVVYPVRTEIRPDGERGPLVARFEHAVFYFDSRSRTWERDALVSARPVAGDRELGKEFVSRIQPWVFRRYLSRADETGIKALKRRIERLDDADRRVDDPVTGRGGVRRIEAAVRFLQLLGGSERETLRGGNTLKAIAGLERAELLSVDERTILEQGYETFRRVEHRRQIVGRSEDMSSDQRERLQKQAETIDKLLQSAFGDEPPAAPETELVLDPAPSAERIGAALRPYGFQDTSAAFNRLRGLSVERIPFLSTRRCRFFLSEIAPHLLQAVAATPDPDYTLGNLDRVSDSLGGKGVLWELFKLHKPSLELYVQLCGASPYLSELLTTSPGMIDELLDSLLLARLPNLSELEATAAELVRAAENPQPILAAFKNAQHLRIGVRQLLGKEDVAAVHRALADVAEACIRLITRAEIAKLTERFGRPTLESGDPCEFVVVGLGKLGGREPHYHSALDLAFVYEADGFTQPTGRSRREKPTTNAHFFLQVAQRVLHVLTELGPQGRLYEVHTHLRRQGNVGQLAVSLAEMRRHLSEDPLPTKARLALVKARPIFGSHPASAAVQNAIADNLLAAPWQPEFGAELRRERLAESDAAAAGNFQQAAGGTSDIEHVIQSLQWQHAGAPGMIGIGALAAIDRLKDAGRLTAADAEAWSEAYRFLRQVETALRLMNPSARHDLPDSTVAWQRLAMLLRQSSPQELAERCHQIMAGNRERLERVFPS